jgi:threonine dehydrogenase-like Zn-dependent dehydrogenase
VRVVRFYAPWDVRVEDAPEPTAGPGELVIRVRNCSVCGTDAKIWGSGHPDLRPPRVLGHEVAGEVVEVGQGAGGWSVGAGPIGCLHVRLARARGAVRELTGGRGADVIIVAAGSGRAQSGAVPVADLITHRLPLEGTIEAIHTVTRGEAIKVTIEA